MRESRKLTAAGTGCQLKAFTEGQRHLLAMKRPLGDLRNLAMASLLPEN